MRITIILLLTFIGQICFGQETKKVNNKDEREVYYVLKSDKSVKHGNYQKQSNNGLVIINGYYKNGVRDSVWEFFDYKGEIEQKFDFTKNDVVFYKADENDKQRKFMLNGADTTKVLLDRPPLYIGGNTMMFEPILKNIKYPVDARTNGASGVVYISFIIDKSGKAINHNVVKGIGLGCDEEALRVVKSIPDNWLPGILNGQPVEVVFNLPVRFALR